MSSVVFGPIVPVDMPDAGVSNIRAKIDTGASISSVWASAISVASGILRYRLFDKGAPGYNGKIIETSDFSKIRVRNSFGKTEERYIVKLPMVVNGVSVKTNVTLANRENNRFSMLIGVNTLRDSGAVVDVNHKNPLKKSKMMIVSAKLTSSVTNFSHHIAQYGKNFSITHTDYSDFEIKIINNRMSVRLLSTGEDLADYDLVHFKTSVSRDITAALARYCAQKDVKILDPIVQYFPTTSKLYQYTILAFEGVKLPDTYFVLPSLLPSRYEAIIDSLGSPFVLKDIHSSRSDRSYVISSRAEFDQVVALLDRDGVYAVAQKFIPNGSDYRILVFGRKIRLVIERSRLEGSKTHLDNTSKNGQASLQVPKSLPLQVRRDSLKSAMALGRDVADVEMTHSLDDGKWYCIEVNDGPRVISGVFAKDKEREFAKYINEKLGY